MNLSLLITTSFIINVRNLPRRGKFNPRVIIPAWLHRLPGGYFSVIPHKGGALPQLPADNSKWRGAFLRHQHRFRLLRERKNQPRAAFAVADQPDPFSQCGCGPLFHSSPHQDDAGFTHKRALQGPERCKSAADLQACRGLQQGLLLLRARTGHSGCLRRLGPPGPSLSGTYGRGPHVGRGLPQLPACSNSAGQAELRACAHLAAQRRPLHHKRPPDHHHPRHRRPNPRKDPGGNCGRHCSPHDRVTQISLTSLQRTHTPGQATPRPDCGGEKNTRTAGAEKTGRKAEYVQALGEL